MANDKTCETTEAIKSASLPNAQTRIIRDSSNMRSAYANMANVASGREEIVLMFGTTQARHAAQSEVNVQLSDRITLNPFAAKRLSILLNNALRDYETRYGPLQLESRRPESPTIQIQPFSKTEKTDEKASLLFHLTKNLNVEIGIERSFKVFEKTILVNRFLLGFKKNTIREKPHERILDICEQMGMPGDLLEAFERYLPDTDYIHFGFEENESACVYKAYLEFYERIEKEMTTRPNISDHFLMHLGFKWDTLDGETTLPYSMIPFLLFFRSFRSPLIYEEQLKKSGFQNTEVQRIDLEMPFFLGVGFFTRTAGVFAPDLPNDLEKLKRSAVFI